MKFKNCAFGILQKTFILRTGFQTCQKRKILASSQRLFSQWQIVSALCLERKPVITQDLTSLEQKYLELLQKMEVEKSYFSDHEMRKKMDEKIAKKGSTGDTEDSEAVLPQTAQDFEDACLEDLNKFQPSPRITDADLNNDKKSIKRKLDSSLVLVVKQKLGNDFRWVLPQAVHEEGETLRQTAERAFKEVCPCHPKLQYMGNAPVGFYKYKYPKVVRGNGICGAKVFFFKAQLLPQRFDRLSIEESDKVNDHMWLAYSELNEVFQPVYCKVIQSFLYPDTFDVDADDSQLSTSENDNKISASHQT